MNLNFIISDFLNKYGTTFTLEDSQTIYNCVISSKSSHDTDFLQQHIERQGVTINGDFIMLTLPDIDNLKKGVKLNCNGRNFLVKSTQDYIVANTKIYKIAVLKAISY